MRGKSLKLIVTFKGGTDALAFERYCQAREVPGRLIPTPRALSESCGLAWMANPEFREEIEKAANEGGLAFEKFVELVC